MPRAGPCTWPREVVQQDSRLPKVCLLICYAQYFATTQVNFDSDRHVQVGGWSNGAWNYFYGQAAPVIQFVEEFTEENELPLENAFIKVWKVQSYHRISDYWGPIIYSSFGNGETSVPYDTQEEVYRDLFQQLDEAVAVLKQNAGGSAFVGHDQIFWWFG